MSFCSFQMHIWTKSDQLNLQYEVFGRDGNSLRVSLFLEVIHATTRNDKADPFGSQWTCYSPEVPSHLLAGCNQVCHWDEAFREVIFLLNFLERLR